MAAEASVLSMTYHTENGIEHLEGDRYTVTDRAMLETLRGIGFIRIESAGDVPDVPPPAPVLSSLTPASVVAGAASLSLSVAGTGFAATDAVQLNGAPVATVFLSASELTASVDAAAIAVPGDIAVSVRTAGALDSNALTLTVTAAG